MYFGGVAVAIDTVLQSLKQKYYWELIKIGCIIFLGMSQKCNDQNTKVVRFYPWKVAIPYFSGANDRIEIDNFCCLVSCSKQLYKWKSLGADSNISNIVVSKINAQWLLFDSDYRKCKQVEKKLGDQWRINQYLYTYAHGNIDTVPGNIDLYI